MVRPCGGTGPRAPGSAVRRFQRGFTSLCWIVLLFARHCQSLSASSLRVGMAVVFEGPPRRLNERRSLPL